MSFLVLAAKEVKEHTSHYICDTVLIFTVNICILLLLNAAESPSPLKS